MVPSPRPTSLSATIKSAAVLGLILGLVCGILYAFGGLVLDIIQGNLGWGTVLAFGALVGMPVIGTLAGAVFGFVLAQARNLAATVLGKRR